MTQEQAILYLRGLPEHAELMRNAYLDDDGCGSAERFVYSEEFAQVLAILGPRMKGATILDLGAGKELGPMPSLNQEPVWRMRWNRTKVARLGVALFRG
jgi:hypothetical protein